MSSQGAESETPQECLPHALLRITEAFLNSPAQCALQYKWFLKGKRKKNKRKLIKCSLADPFNTNNVTRSMATVSAGLPGHWQGHRTPCTLTGIYLQRSWISPNAESSQIPLNYFKVNRSWGNWAPPDKPFRNPWPFLLHVVTLFILHVLQEPTGIVTGSIISSEYSAEHCPVITVSRETWHFHLSNTYGAFTEADLALMLPQASACQPEGW